MKQIIKTIYYLRRFYDTNDALNGLYENRYTFKQKNDNYLYVTIYKKRGEISFINKKARMNDIFTRENLIAFLSNDVYPIDIVSTLSLQDPNYLSFIKQYRKELIKKVESREPADD